MPAAARGRRDRRVLPKLPRAFKPVFTRGPVGLQRALLARPKALPDFTAFMAARNASKPEAAVYWAHTQLGLVEPQDFTFQSSQLGGRKEYGGAVLDFVEYRAPIGINVQGLYYHYGLGSGQIARDQLQRYEVARFGLTLIFIDEDQATSSAVIYLVQEALRGIDHSRGRYW